MIIQCCEKQHCIITFFYFEKNIIKLIYDSKLQAEKMPCWDMYSYFYNIRMVLNSKFQQETINYETINNSCLFLEFLYIKIINNINKIFTKSELQEKLDEFEHEFSKTQDEQFIFILKNKKESNNSLSPMEERLLELLEKEKKKRLKVRIIRNENINSYE